MTVDKTEVWLKGPLPTIPDLLQPAAHALLQAQTEIIELLQNFPEEKLWYQPAGVASVGFHLKHIVGVLDRLTTYAAGQNLSEKQLAYLREESNISANTLEHLIEALRAQIAITLTIFQQVDVATLTHYRSVGRLQLPSTVIGLYFHAAEHTMRHLGQLLVTVKFLSA